MTVSAALPNFKVYLDGKLYAKRIRDGSMAINRLPVKHYQMHVAADGFEPSPDRDIEVKKGQTSAASVVLTAIPQFATLRPSRGSRRTPRS